jgi:hypothetical protein
MQRKDRKQLEAELQQAEDLLEKRSQHFQQASSQAKLVKRIVVI